MNKYRIKSQNTSEKMYKALIDILEEKEFIDISVKELCIVAGINRTTFYARYDNLVELLVDTEKYIINSFTASFNGASIKDIKYGEYKEDLLSKEYLIPYLKFFKDNNKLVMAFIKNELHFSSAQHFRNMIENVSLPMAKKRGGVDEKQVYYSSVFFVNGIIAVIKEWMKNGFKESEEYIADIIAFLRYKE